MTDWILPLYGANSIIGRSIVIHATDGSRFACASIGYPGAVTMATANFFYPVIGQLVMYQTSADSAADTVVMARLSYADGQTASAAHVNGTIHEKPSVDDLIKDESRCAQTGSQYKAAGKQQIQFFSTFFWWWNKEGGIKQ